MPRIIFRKIHCALCCSCSTIRKPIAAPTARRSTSPMTSGRPASGGNGPEEDAADGSDTETFHCDQVASDVVLGNRYRSKFVGMSSPRSCIASSSELRVRRSRNKSQTRDIPENTERERDIAAAK